MSLGHNIYLVGNVYCELNAYAYTNHPIAVSCMPVVERDVTSVFECLHCSF